MKRKNLVLAGFLVLTLVSFATDKIIDILSITDLHGRVYEAQNDLGISKLSSAIKEFQKDDENYSTVLVSGGDNYQGSGISNISKGDIISEFFNEVGMKYSAMGNHDTYWGFDYFDKWSEEGDMTYLCANVIDSTTKGVPSFVKPYDIIELQGIKIAFVGLAVERKQLQTNPDFFEGYELTDPLEALNYYNEEARDNGADVVIGLAHIGGKQSQKAGSWGSTSLGEVTGEIVPILEGAKNLDGFIAGDSHDLVIGSVNNIPVVQGDTYGKYLANLRIVVGEDSEIKSITPWIDDLFLKKDILEKDIVIEDIIAKYEKGYSDELAKEITELEEIYGHRETIVKVAEYMKNYNNSDVAILNNGTVRSPAPSLVVNYVDMHQILPFDYKLVEVQMNGQELLSAIEEKKANGKFTSAGLLVKNGRYYLEDGKRIRKNKNYTITLVDPLISGVEGLTSFIGLEHEVVSENLRDTVIETLVN